MLQRYAQNALLRKQKRPSDVRRASADGRLNLQPPVRRPVLYPIELPAGETPNKRKKEQRALLQSLRAVNTPLFLDAGRKNTNPPVLLEEWLRNIQLALLEMHQTPKAVMSP